MRFIRLTRSVNRGSPRNRSNIGSTASNARYQSRSWYACSSHLNARSVSPSPIQIVAREKDETCLFCLARLFNIRKHRHLLRDSPRVRRADRDGPSKQLTRPAFNWPVLELRCECASCASALKSRGHAWRSTHAAPLHSCKYRWLHAPATNIICMRSSSLGDLSSPQPPRGANDARCSAPALP
jgi:hypothetical protein